METIKINGVEYQFVYTKYNSCKKCDLFGVLGTQCADNSGECYFGVYKTIKNIRKNKIKKIFS